MNIKREFFAAIVAGTKHVEYRQMSTYWKARIDPLTVPFTLRLLNGMTPPVSEAIVVVTEVTRDEAKQEYSLHLGEVQRVQHWDGRAVDAKQNAEELDQDVPLRISPALAAVIGPGNKSTREIIKLFWAYVADHQLHVEGGKKLRVDLVLRDLVGPKGMVGFAEVVASINKNIEPAVP